MLLKYTPVTINEKIKTAMLLRSKAVEAKRNEIKNYNLDELKELEMLANVRRPYTKIISELQRCLKDGDYVPRLTDEQWMMLMTKEQIEEIIRVENYSPEDHIDTDNEEITAILNEFNEHGLANDIVTMQETLYTLLILGIGEALE